jgi:type 1 fimbria pilin
MRLPSIPALARALFASLLLSLLASVAAADQITFTGTISQSLDVSQQQAINNPDLNNIALGDAYTVTFDFPGSITGPGLYQPGTFNLVFHDSTNPTSESNFSSVSLSVLTDGSDPTALDISMFACVPTGSGCLLGNSLSANFLIPAAGLNSQNVAAQIIPGLFPQLDLLEDDGATDIQGSVDKYSYVPEPSAAVPLTLLLTAMVWLRRRREQGRSTHYTRRTTE